MNLYAGLDTGATVALVVLAAVDGRLHFVDGASSRSLHMQDGAIWLDTRSPLVSFASLSGLAVELPGAIQGGGKSHGAGLSIAKGLIASGIQGGQVLGWAEALGIPTHRVTAKQWRKALCGKGHARDRDVKARLPDLVRGLPARSNEHVRDAAMVAVWCAQQAALAAESEAA